MFSKFVQHYRQSYQGISRNVWMLSFVTFINHSGTMVLFFLTLYLTKRLGLTLTQAGQMMSVYGIGALLGAYLGGKLTDKIGNLHVQMYSLILSGVLFIIISFLDQVIFIAIALFILAAVAEAMKPASTAAFALFTPVEDRARSFAVQRLANNLGVAIGPAVGGFLARINYLYLFWVDGITCVLAGLMLFIVFRSEISTEQQVKPKPVGNKSKIWQDKIFLAILLFTFLLGTVFMQLLSTWPVYLRNQCQLLENQIGILLTINTLMIAFIEIPLIHKLEKKRTLRVMALGAVLLCFGFGILPLHSGYKYIILTVVIWTMGEILIFPMLSSFVSNRADESSLGSYMGMYSLAFSFSFTLAPAIGGFIYDVYNPNLLWFGIGIMGLFVSIGFLNIDRVLKHQAIKTE